MSLQSYPAQELYALNNNLVNAIPARRALLVEPEDENFHYLDEDFDSEDLHYIDDLDMDDEDIENEDEDFDEEDLEDDEDEENLDDEDMDEEDLEDDEDMDEEDVEEEEEDNENLSNYDVCRKSKKQHILNAGTLRKRIDAKLKDIVEDLDDDDTGATKATRTRRAIDKAHAKANSLKEKRRLSPAQFRIFTSYLETLRSKITQASKNGKVVNKKELKKDAKKAKKAAKKTEKKIKKKQVKNDKKLAKDIFKAKETSKAKLITNAREAFLQLIEEEGTKLKGCGGAQSITPDRARVLLKVMYNRLKDLRRRDLVSREGYKNAVKLYRSADKKFKAMKTPVTIETIKKFAREN
jgi:hypothetical protein